MGNLTLLKQKLNSKISNGPFKAKKAEIMKNSSMAINAFVLSKESWSEADIEERGRQLFAVATKLWPYAFE